MTEYVFRVLPAFIPIALVFFILKPRAAGRVVIYIMVFILLRDTMTPLGLWRLGREGFFWLRFTEDPIFLLLFGAAGAVMMTALIRLDRENRRHIRFFRGHKGTGVLLGLSAALIIVLPFIFPYSSVSLSARGGTVAPRLLMPIAVIALGGNFLEEGLFRGYVLGYLQERFSPLIAAAGSGILFSFCHMFLAITVSDAGLPVIIFTLWEGCIAGLVGVRRGLIPAALAHGGAVFLLAAGLF